eukprot:11201179-Lingulodinium_polyedra.AAC.1
MPRQRRAWSGVFGPRFASANATRRRDAVAWRLAAVGRCLSPRCIERVWREARPAGCCLPFAARQ